MTRIQSKALALAHPVVRGLTVLNLLYAAGLVLLLAALLLTSWPIHALGFDTVSGPLDTMLGLRSIVVIGIIGAAIVHSMLRRLLAIVDSVRDADPFNLGNARHLEVIAWSVLALELLRAVVSLIGAGIGWPRLGGGFSFAPWLAVLLLFVLAGVFAQGARMRDDLEGTV